ncbi:hypothetical protein GCM10011390_39660 [Aureimonas endophytica]|jgi:hypothetical protein|uniref:Uncharacterized protein n=1 Tax=Aureimonas endophytica TaxID=2027858 RepID=A0A916ZX62_9HYPH|nr:MULTISPECIES: hypothetical protein [Aureimonas]GGE16656.1 hypothetical protein GCM10011390_39660 [Aureimonas endophytica]
MQSIIEITVEHLERSGPAWGAPLHTSNSDEPRTAAIGLFPSGGLELLPDITDPYSPAQGGFAKALIPLYGGIRRDALVALLRRLVPDLGTILDGAEDGAFTKEALELLENIRTEAGRRGFGEDGAASIEHFHYYVGDTVSDLGIAPDTTDDDLARIEATLRANAIAQEVMLVGNVRAFLREVRENAAEIENA